MFHVRMASFPKCTVCKKHFELKGPDPFLSPCLHAVCGICLTSCTTGQLFCSVCKSDVDLKKTALDRVRQRFILHLTAKHRPAELLCTHEEDGNQAVCWCQDCEEFLCEHCQNLHESFKANRGHTVCGVAEIGSSKDEEDSYCSIHKKYVLEQFDHDCGVLICLKCKQGDHAGHATDDIQTVAESSREELKQNARLINNVKTTIQEELSENSRQALQLHESEGAQREKISLTFDALRAVVDQRQKEITANFNTHMDQAYSPVSQRRSMLTVKQNAASIVSEYTQLVLEYASKSDLAGITGIIRDKVKDSLNFEVQKRTKDQSSVTFFTNDFPEVKDAISKFSSISCDGKPAVTNTSSNQHLSYAELQQRCAALEKEANSLKATIARLQTSDKAAIARIQTSGRAAIARLQTSDRAAIAPLQTSDRTAIARLQTSDRTAIARLQTSDKPKEQKTPDARDLPVPCDFLSAATFRLLNGETVSLHCINLKYSSDKMNIDKVHIDTEGVLCNKPDPSGRGDERLHTYRGTCSTYPLLPVDFLQYWEMLALVRLDQMVALCDHIMETGVCREDMRDRYIHIGMQPHSYSMCVHRCPTHGGICNEIRREGTKVMCEPDVFINKQQTTATLHYGVIFDYPQKKIAFLDVKGRNVLTVLENIDVLSPLWPMFGVSIQNRGSVKMRLIVGEDITLSEEKKALIFKAISQQHFYQ